MDVDIQAKRREHARKLAVQIGRKLRGEFQTRMSIVADRAFRSKVEAIRQAIANRTNGERSACMSDVIRYCVNVIYWDLIGDTGTDERSEDATATSA